MSPKKICNILLNNFLGILNKHKVGVADCGIEPEDFLCLAKLLHTGALDKKQFSEIVDRRIAEHKQNQASFFPEELDVTQLQRLNPAYPDRIIKEFEK